MQSQAYEEKMMQEKSNLPLLLIGSIFCIKGKTGSGIAYETIKNI